jgi:hypothetical protein
MMNIPALTAHSFVLPVMVIVMVIRARIIHGRCLS